MSLFKFKLNITLLVIFFRFRNTNSINRLCGSGRPRILLDNEAREVVAMATVEPFMPSNEIRDNLQLQVSIYLQLNDYRLHYIYI